MQLAHDVAAALAYLHPSVVHRDLKPQVLAEQLRDQRADRCAEYSCAGIAHQGRRQLCMPPGRQSSQCPMLPTTGVTLVVGPLQGAPPSTPLYTVLLLIPPHSRPPLSQPRPLQQNLP